MGGLGLRFGRSTTYVNGGPPAIEDDDLNDLQDRAVDFWSVVRGEDVYVSDHFVGNSINTTLWAQTTTGTAAVAATDDTGNAASGSVELTANGSSSAALASLKAGRSLNVASDFWVSLKARTAATAPYTGGGCEAILGLYGAGGDGLSAAIMAGVGVSGGGGGTSPNWCLAIGATGGSDIVYDLGVALDTSYHTFDIVSLSGAVTVYVDGTKKYTGTYGSSLAGTHLLLEASSSFHGSSCGLYVDRAALWFPG